MTGEPILWLDDLEPGELKAVAGSKIARLTELGRVGFTVPRGFAVMTSAYRSFCAASGLDKLIAGEEGELDESALDHVAAVSEQLRAAIEAEPMPAALVAGIVDAYEELAYRCRQLRLPVAVRSSATGEDAAEASCAGQFESYLGVSGGDAVAAAVKRCWASLFSPRAILYRLAHGFSHEAFPMAVGVMELIDARSSG
ncbi:MAG: PEP/pyruvate-binding domain-containing protein, partial [Acidimicrobiia bacterium]